MKRGPYKTKHEKLDKDVTIRMSQAGIDVAKKAASLLGLDFTNLIRLGIKQVITEMPYAACAAATEHARSVLERKLEKRFKRPFNDIDFTSQEVREAITSFTLTDAELKAAKTFIEVAPGGHSYRKFGKQPPQDAIDSINRAMDPKTSPVDRQLAKGEATAFLRERVRTEFEAHKADLLRLPELWDQARKIPGLKGIEKFKHDPQMLDFLITRHALEADLRSLQPANPGKRTAAKGQKKKT